MILSDKRNKRLYLLCFGTATNMWKMQVQISNPCATRLWYFEWQLTVKIFKILTCKCKLQELTLLFSKTYKKCKTKLRCFDKIYDFNYKLSHTDTWSVLLSNCQFTIFVWLLLCPCSWSWTAARTLPTFYSLRMMVGQVCLMSDSHSLITAVTVTPYRALRSSLYTMRFRVSLIQSNKYCC